MAQEKSNPVPSQDINKFDQYNPKKQPQKQN